MVERVAVVGLGYVGLPVALAFARKFRDTVGFDVDAEKILELRAGYDRNQEQAENVLRTSMLDFVSDSKSLAGKTFFIVAVPTPVDENNVPDLGPLIQASEIVGKALSPGAVVVYESTVYPGVTEEICGPVLENTSGLVRGKDFTVAYSPERINPGDKEHTLEKITKIVSGEDAATLERVSSAYSEIIDAGVYRAPSIKVAEAAKVIENTQRDLNIALINELAIIFDRIGIRTADVLAAAATKWNFLPFKPGLVGGHCIGVDPYYLTTKAQRLGYQPEVMLAGRRINNGMGYYIAQRVVKLLIEGKCLVQGARVGILGLTFKENCHDIRNSKVPDIVRELETYGIDTFVHDPLADAPQALHEHRVKLTTFEELPPVDVLILAVAHDWYLQRPEGELFGLIRQGGAFVDVKSVFDPARVHGVRYWSL